MSYEIHGSFPESVHVDRDRDFGQLNFIVEVTVMIYVHLKPPRCNI
jgi:hypothetical protein